MGAARAWPRWHREDLGRRAHRRPAPGPRNREAATPRSVRPRSGRPRARPLRPRRRVLARLTHPHIAHLLDAGPASDGTRYLVLKHMHGQRIDDWRDDRQLGTEARLQLFVQVCAPVQFALAHLIVHRDLKPANLLVTVNAPGANRTHGSPTPAPAAARSGSTSARRSCSKTRPRPMSSRASVPPARRPNTPRPSRPTVTRSRWRPMRMRSAC